MLDSPNAINHHKPIIRGYMFIPSIYGHFMAIWGMVYDSVYTMENMPRQQKRRNAPRRRALESLDHMNHIFDSYNREMEAAGLQRCPPKDRAVIHWKQENVEIL